MISTNIHFHGKSIIAFINVPQAAITSSINALKRCDGGLSHISQFPLGMNDISPPLMVMGLFCKFDLP